MMAVGSLVHSVTKSTASPMLSMPWAITPGSSASSAVASDQWMGLKSLEAPAYRIRSARLMPMVRVAITSPLVSFSIAGIITSLSANQQRGSDRRNGSAISIGNLGCRGEQPIAGKLFRRSDTCLSEQFIAGDHCTVVGEALISVHYSREIDFCFRVIDHQRFGTLGNGHQIGWWGHQVFVASSTSSFHIVVQRVHIFDGGSKVADVFASNVIRANGGIFAAGEVNSHV